MWAKLPDDCFYQIKTAVRQSYRAKIYQIKKESLKWDRKTKTILPTEICFI